MATSSPASSATAAASGGSVTTVVTETLAGTRVLMTVDGYSKTKEVLFDTVSRSIKSERFRAGGTAGTSSTELGTTTG
jgi:speckle-type POZ protein